MVVYYRGPDARITDEVFESHQPTYQRFAIAELAYLHTVKEEAVFVAAASNSVRVCSAGASGVTALVAVAGWPVFDRPMVSAIGLVLFGLAAGSALAAGRARRRPLVIRAVYRGRLVCLYSTTNRRTHGQVTRALLRVIEAAADAR
jgi:Family of unknown function (DUF6232)